MNEDAWKSRVVDTARLHHWLVGHFRPALMADGRWRTPVEYDGAGFPDLCLSRAGVVMLVELKSDTGTVSSEQRRWLEASGGHVWRPRDWPEVMRMLTAPCPKTERR